MSWPGEEWKVGLPPQALRAIGEVEQRLERAQKERQQKQRQLDTLEGLMDKQRQKHEEEKASWALLSQENRKLAESCEQTERARQRLAQDLQAKETQVSCLKAQLAQATRRQAELEEELHRCQAALEKHQAATHLSCLPPWAEGGAEAKTDNNKTPPAATVKAEQSIPPLGEPCATDMTSKEAPFPSGDGDQSVTSELASEGEKLRAENQELRRALAQAESRIHEKEQELRSLQGQVEVIQLELAQWKKEGGCGNQVEPAEARDLQGRRLSEDVARLRRSREQEKGLAGTERPSCGGSRRSASSSRLEQLAEKRGSAARPKGSAFLSPKALSTERSQEELPALRAEVLALRRRLEASESQRKNLLETCWQQQRTRAWVQERQMPPLGLRAAAWQRKKEGRHNQPGSHPQALEGKEAFGAGKPNGKNGVLPSGGQKAPEARTAELQRPEDTEPETGTPDLPAEQDKERVSLTGQPEETEALTQLEVHVEGKCELEGSPEAVRETVRSLAAGKAEAEAQADLLEQKLQALQATLGDQTERLAEALEAQSCHVEELVAEAEAKERLVSSLRRELEEATKGLEEAHAEKRRLQALLERKEEELRDAKRATELHGDRKATEWTKSLTWGPRDRAAIGRIGLDVGAQKEKHAQAELETFLAQLLRENQALRSELIHWEAMVVGKGTLDSCSISSVLHGEATAGSVLQASQKVALLIQESQRDVQTQTEGHEVGVRPRRRERVSVAFDDTRYEPYGLPEVVMKGFADIPVGPSCPYVLRRGILGSAPVAQLAPKAEPEEDGLEPDEEEMPGA